MIKLGVIILVAGAILIAGLTYILFAVPSELPENTAYNKVETPTDEFKGPTSPPFVKGPYGPPPQE